jgi:hypothetical protein
MHSASVVFCWSLFWCFIGSCSYSYKNYVGGKTVKGVQGKTFVRSAISFVVLLVKMVGYFFFFFADAI